MASIKIDKLGKDFDFNYPAKGYIFDKENQRFADTKMKSLDEFVRYINALEETEHKGYKWFESLDWKPATDLLVNLGA